MPPNLVHFMQEGGIVQYCAPPRWGVLEANSMPGFNSAMIYYPLQTMRIGRVSLEIDFPRLTPKLPIQHAIIYRFANVLGANFVRAFEVRNRARDAEHLVVCAGRETHLLDALSQQIASAVVEPAVFADFAGRHLGILPRVGTQKASSLHGSGRHHVLAHGCARGAIMRAAKLFERHGRHFDVQVDAVEQWPANFGHISLDLRHAAVAFASRIVAIPARAWVERRDQHESCRERGGVQSATDGDMAVFERLAEHFESRSIEFGQLVKEQNAVVGEADLPGRGGRSAAHKASVGNCVMRGTKRATRE
jgi:hypothetical protein